MNINFNKLIKFIIPFFYISTVVYLIEVGLYIYLPKNHIVNIKHNLTTLEYKRFNIVKSYIDTKEKINQNKVKKEYKLLSNLILKAIYVSSEHKGWIIIEQRKNHNTHILECNEYFNGYKLVSLYSNYVVFVKNHKEYSLKLVKEGVKNYILTPKPKFIQHQDSTIIVKKDLIKQYTKNYKKIWKEIKIKEIKVDNKIDGFKVLKIDKKGVFYELGLRKNDIIKAVNNTELKSYKDAFTIYGKIKYLKELNLKILRDKQEVEINYELQ